MLLDLDVLVVLLLHVLLHVKLVERRTAAASSHLSRSLSQLRRAGRWRFAAHASSLAVLLFAALVRLLVLEEHELIVFLYWQNEVNVVLGVELDRRIGEQSASL